MLKLSNTAPCGLAPCAAVAAVAAVASFGPAAPAAGLVYGNDSNDGVALSLRNQGQFGGVGGVLTGGGIGTGVAISREWILTAAHFTTHNQATTFSLDGVRYAGKTVQKGGNRAGSDVALIRLDPGVRLPSDTPFIAPLQDGNSLDQLIWKVGIGRAGRANQVQGDPNNLPFGAGMLRAGTNVFNSKRDLSAVNGFGPSLVMNRSSGANETVFESTTAPGDSGGPAFLQRGNQWFIAGLTSGAFPGVGFVEADVFADIDFIRNTTGLAFAPQAAPTELFWDPDFASAGVQTGGGSWDQERPFFTAGGFQYTWESDFAPTAVFGTPTSKAALVTVNGDISAAGIRFAPTLEPSGPFQLLDGTGALVVGTRGLEIDSQVFARIGAEVTGGGAVRKTGAAALVFDGANNDFTGKIFVDEGTLITSNGGSFGAGGFSAATPTDIADGATVEFRGTGFSTDELFRLVGSGDGGNGSLHVSTGDHTITQSVQLQGSTTVRVDGGASLTLGGARGNFFQPGAVRATVTKDGAGTLVLERINGASALAVAEGVLAGTGGVSGSVSVEAGAELRVGDGADGPGVGAFRTDDFTLAAGGLLTIDLDAAAGSGDVLNVRGASNIAGTLALNLLSAPVAGTSYVILDNDGLDPILGLFGNGPLLSAGFGGVNYDFAINYAAGSGNDVALTLLAIPEPGTAVALAAIGLGLLGRRRCA